MSKLNYGEIEKKWQKYWSENKTNRTENDFSNNKKKFYILDMFPYPSGEGLHVGHPKGYIATDVYSRLKKMQGYNVLHPMGWDAFGLPAEQFAIKNKINPNIATAQNVKRYKEQIEMLGINYDWDREINTTDPKYYKWTQWMFKQMYKDGLAYESFEPINWCPSCKTGLSNEDLDGNACERCGTIVEKKPLRQWVIKITDYADRLLADLDKLDWEPHIKELQRNWIGKSVGSEIDFEIKNSKENNLKENKLKIFTTRADTLFGCTFMCISYTLAKEWIKGGWDASETIKNFIAKLEKEEKERSVDFDMSKLEKEGIDTGVKAINPANGEEVPIYIANYILSDYGTGAIMAVPAHDERDFEFAKKYNLEIRKVVKDKEEKESKELFEDEGALLNSGEFSEMNSEEARIEITEKVGGKIVSKYKLKDWVFARQRYWGEPFPIVFDEERKSFSVADKELPVILPNVENYEPTDNGESPLANIKDWVEVYGFINAEGEFESCEDGDPKGKKFFRETNTMPQWAGSSWYYLRYIDPKNDEKFIDKELEKNWNPVDFYVGGAEHATRHLIYARFWHKFLFDKGFVSYDEPFSKLQTVGLIMAEDGKKMSKRYGNVVSPDDIVAEFGADAMRTYEMFMGPFEKSIAWNTNSIAGVSRFLERVYNLIEKVELKEEIIDNKEIERVINETIKKVGVDIQEFKFNTAIAQMMICMNSFEEETKKGNKISRKTFSDFIQILSPFAVHICEEIWQNVLGNNFSIHTSVWPEYFDAKIIKEEIEMSLQISGKFRGTFLVKNNIEDRELSEFIKSLDLYKKYISDDTEIKNTIIVKNRLVNIVI
jgi:leucyl-tRNA synthetase